MWRGLEGREVAPLFINPAISFPFSIQRGIHSAAALEEVVVELEVVELHIRRPLPQQHPLRRPPHPLF
jgi:hypothetical protein